MFKQVVIVRTETEYKDAVAEISQKRLTCSLLRTIKLPNGKDGLSFKSAEHFVDGHRTAAKTYFDELWFKRQHGDI